MAAPRPDAFDELQATLGSALEANRPGSTTDHVVIAMPSYSVSESILSHYRDRIPSLEHRYLLALFVASRIPSCEIVYVSTRRPDDAIVDYYAALKNAYYQDRMARIWTGREHHRWQPSEEPTVVADVSAHLEPTRRALTGRRFLPPGRQSSGSH